MKRREAIRLLGFASVGALFLTTGPYTMGLDDPPPPLAPGAPTSPERMALIEAFRKTSSGLDKKFESGTFKSDVVMPYRLFRPGSPRKGKLPLVVFLHGSGGLGDDNEQQMGQGNIFGTRVWALPENQKRFPCYVLAPQTDRGWVNYDLSAQTDGKARVLPGFGDSARQVVEIINKLKKEIPIDDRRIYITGQSMGGAGVWNLITYSPKVFAAAVICCGSVSSEDGTGGVKVPLWNFHGEVDKTVPVTLSRERIAARRKAGGHPLYTEYAGVDHNSWQWAYTEPEMVEWVFAQKRK